VKRACFGMGNLLVWIILAANVVAQSVPPGGGNSGTNNDPPLNTVPGYGTNLWLSINLSNNAVQLLLHNTQPGVPYQIRSRPDLVSGSWLYEGTVTGAGRGAGAATGAATRIGGGGVTGAGRTTDGATKGARLDTGGATRMTGDAGRGAGNTTCGRLALACSSFSRAMSCADLTKTPAGTRVVKPCGFSAVSTAAAVAFSPWPPAAPSGAEGVGAAPGASIPAAGGRTNSCSKAAAVILSIVLETVLTG
jgi:hypothetical protein